MVKVRAEVLMVVIVAVKIGDVPLGKFLGNR